MIKNVIFDMGNVLIEFKPINYLNGLDGDAAVAEEICREMFCQGEWEELDRGGITEDEAYQSICARIPAHSEYVKQAMTGWFQDLKPIEGMCDLVKDLKGKGYRIYLLSNASSRIFEYMHNIPALQYFDGYRISCEIQVNKPSLEIYQSLMKKYNLAADECIFIDDLPRNIEGAKAAGWQGYVFTGVQDLRQYLNEQQILGDKIEV
jgi:putative hydrolase of the HAD superfamily